ncbi:MAG: uroporphyrinogen decarboxylase family protein [Atribacterota bacterium]
MEEKKGYLRRFWQRKEKGPVWYIGSPGEALLIEEGTIPSFEAMLQAELRRIENRTHILDFDVPAIRTDFGTSIFPSAFGCPLHFSKGRYPWGEPVLFDDSEKVFALKKPSVRDGLLGVVLDFTHFAAGATRETLPIKMTDLQGPMDVAYLLWESNDFFLALFDAPRAVHHLLGMVTELMIEFVHAQRSAVQGAEFIPCHLQHYLPWGEGICVSEDLLSLLSPELYREFALPYINILSREFGGVFIHSCGNFVHNLEVLLEIENLKGINFGATETPFEEVVGKLGNRVVLSPHVGLNKDVVFESVFHYLTHLERWGNNVAGLYVLVDTTNSLLGHDMAWNGDELEKIYRIFARWSEQDGE